MIESTHVLGVSLRVVLLEDGSVLGEKTLLFFRNNLALAHFLLFLELLIAHLGLALSLVDKEFFLPQALDFALVFQFAHSTFLGIHLLQTLILRELFHKLALELFFHSLFFFCTLSF